MQKISLIKCSVLWKKSRKIGEKRKTIKRCCSYLTKKETKTLVQFELMKVDQNWVFDQFESGPKVGLSNVINNFEEK